MDVARELVWADGRLIFESETLARALIEFNRRNRLQLQVTDPAIVQRPVRGVFGAADPQSFVDFLPTAASGKSGNDPAQMVVQDQRIKPWDAAQEPRAAEVSAERN